MNVPPKEIPVAPPCLSVIEKRNNHFFSRLHRHAALQITYIKSGSGIKVIGNRMDDFHAGEIILVGCNIPHAWIKHKDSAAPTPSSACRLVAYLNPDIFSKHFYELTEHHHLNLLLAKADRGIQLHGKTRYSVGRKIERLVKKKGLKKIIGMLEILECISLSGEIECINAKAHEPSSNTETDRLADVYDYIGNHFNQDISLGQIAGIAHLSIPAFCRSFKMRTNRSFVQYLNEIRISQAARYLAESDLNIAEVALRSGFRTLSNFNKIFKQHMQYTPRNYRQQMKALRME